MNIVAPKRAYRQGARAAAAEATGERIIDAFVLRLRSQWFDEIRLEDVAREAGVTVQTVIRRFGGKEGLLEAAHERIGREIRNRRETPPGDAAGAIDSIVMDYEEVGDLILRTLAQEDRHPAIRKMTDIGRAMHREWMGAAFAPWLRRMAPDEARRAADGLVVAGDLYVWKLVRRDMGRSIAEYRALVERLIAASLGIPTYQLHDAPKMEPLP